MSPFTVNILLISCSAYYTASAIGAHAMKNKLNTYRGYSKAISLNSSDTKAK
ncbi:hypothetical protein BCV70DRAFT_200869 [Testicularia cyperi]|uniref:Uncharacterized protein n=1 Tax=Testicularia cyperi TaxID=1882483 RepID=A0A317XMJ1_9BASI|nr:hypothetical protein BCV70DRAFT_200869 [Testicularia cyperi]